MEAPRGIAQNFMRHPGKRLLPIQASCHRARRSEHMETILFAQRMNAKKMGSIAHNNDPRQMVRAGNHRKPFGGLGGIVALRLGNNGGLGNSVREKIIVAYSSLRVGIANVSASQRDDQRRKTLLLTLESVVQACTQHRRRPPVVFRSPEYSNRIRGPGLIAVCIIANLAIDPGRPAGSPYERQQDHTGNNPPAGRASRQVGFRNNHGKAQRCSASAISCVAIAPSRRICQRPLPSERFTIVVGRLRPVGPPSTITGMRSPIWSRTQAAWVHSGAPCKLAEVAVTGRPKVCVTARGMAASGIRKATLPVLAVTRRGSRELALTISVRGPGQKRSANRSKFASSSRASS